MCSRIRQCRAAGSIELALGALASVALLGGCSGRQAPATPRSVASTSTATAEKNGPQVAGQTGVPSPFADTTPSGNTTSTPPATPPPPEEVRTAWREGVALVKKGNYSSASSHLQIAADARQKEPYTQYLLGITLWKSG